MGLLDFIFGKKKDAKTSVPQSSRNRRFQDLRQLQVLLQKLQS